jgi:DNA-binding NarL/FixJ family response regulator
VAVQRGRLHPDPPAQGTARVARGYGPRLAAEAVKQLHLSGYIPTSRSLELAATALRLIIAGGHYIPGGCSDADPATPRALQDPPMSVLDVTTRERAMLKLLQCGLPNKVVTCRLQMSPSTVKAHVHSIIVQLNVRDRTEATLARYAALERDRAAMTIDATM